MDNVALRPPLKFFFLRWVLISISTKPSIYLRGFFQNAFTQGWGITSFAGCHSLPQIFVSHTGRMKWEVVTSQQISGWIMCISTCYDIAKSKPPSKLMAHSASAQTVSGAFWKNIPILNMCRAVTWSPVHIFIKHCAISLASRSNVDSRKAVLQLLFNRLQALLHRQLLGSHRNGIGMWNQMMKKKQFHTCTVTVFLLDVLHTSIPWPVLLNCASHLKAQQLQHRYVTIFPLYLEEVDSLSLFF